MDFDSLPVLSGWNYGEITKKSHQLKIDGDKRRKEWEETQPHTQLTIVEVYLKVFC